jgi:hypothetical protein
MEDRREMIRYDLSYGGAVNMQGKVVWRVSKEEYETLKKRLGDIFDDDSACQNSDWSGHFLLFSQLIQIEIFASISVIVESTIQCLAGEKKQNVRHDLAELHELIHQRSTPAFAVRFSSCTLQAIWSRQAFLCLQKGGIDRDFSSAPPNAPSICPYVSSSSLTRYFSAFDRKITIYEYSRPPVRQEAFHLRLSVSPAALYSLNRMPYRDDLNL